MKALIENLRQQAIEAGLASFTQDIEAIAQPCFLMASANPEDYAQVGNTRIGGYPDLPPHTEWHTENGEFFSFLCQLNLAEMPASSDLPATGMLYFFLGYDDTCSDIETKVLYCDCDRSSPKRSFPPANSEIRCEDNCYFEHPYTASIIPYLSLPLTYDPPIQNFPEKLCNAYVDFVLGWIDPLVLAHQIRGYTNDFCGEDPRQVAVKHKGGEVGDWVLLVAFGYDSKVGFCFWDAGTLYFVIRKTDLAARNFSDVVASLHTS